MIANKMFCQQDNLFPFHLKIEDCLHEFFIFLRVGHRKKDFGCVFDQFLHLLVSHVIFFETLGCQFRKGCVCLCENLGVFVFELVGVSEDTSFIDKCDGENQNCQMAKSELCSPWPVLFLDVFEGGLYAIGECIPTNSM